nr:J domain-containing protein [Conchiformibius kuhniae]
MHIHTHYDNLQLPQTATDAEIRQAYRRLSKRYHPDLNADPDAHRIMQLINRAYEVLSDPSSRAEHDRWIRAQYRRQYEVMPQPITYYYAAEAAAPPAKPALRQTKLLLLLSALTLLLAVFAFWLGLGWLQRPPPAPVAAPPSAQPIHINIGVQGAAPPPTPPRPNCRPPLPPTTTAPPPPPTAARTRRIRLHPRLPDYQWHGQQHHLRRQRPQLVRRVRPTLRKTQPAAPAHLLPARAQRTAPEQP